MTYCISMRPDGEVAFYQEKEQKKSLKESFGYFEDIYLEDDSYNSLKEAVEKVRGNNVILLTEDIDIIGFARDFNDEFGHLVENFDVKPYLYKPRRLREGDTNQQQQQANAETQRKDNSAVMRGLVIWSLNAPVKGSYAIYSKIKALISQGYYIGIPVPETNNSQFISQAALIKYLSMIADIDTSHLISLNLTTKGSPDAKKLITESLPDANIPSKFPIVINKEYHNALVSALAPYQNTSPNYCNKVLGNILEDSLVPQVPLSQNQQLVKFLDNIWNDRKNKKLKDPTESEIKAKKIDKPDAKDIVLKDMLKEYDLFKQGKTQGYMSTNDMVKNGNNLADALKKSFAHEIDATKKAMELGGLGIVENIADLAQKFGKEEKKATHRSEESKELLKLMNHQDWPKMRDMLDDIKG